MEAFKVAAQPVSVQEYLAFVTDPQGYRNPAWWSERDYKLLNASGRGSPAPWTVKVRCAKCPAACISAQHSKCSAPFVSSDEQACWHERPQAGQRKC